MLLLFTALQKTQFCEQQRASRCTDTEHSAPYRAGRLGIFMRRRIKTPCGPVAVNSGLPFFSGLFILEGKRNLHIYKGEIIL